METVTVDKSRLPSKPRCPPRCRRFSRRSRPPQPKHPWVPGRENSVKARWKPILVPLPNPTQPPAGLTGQHSSGRIRLKSSGAQKARTQNDRVIGLEDSCLTAPKNSRASRAFGIRCVLCARPAGSTKQSSGVNGPGKRGNRLKNLLRLAALINFAGQGVTRSH